MCISNISKKTVSTISNISTKSNLHFKKDFMYYIDSLNVVQKIRVDLEQEFVLNYQFVNNLVKFPDTGISIEICDVLETITYKSEQLPKSNGYSKPYVDKVSYEKYETQSLEPTTVVNPNYKIESVFKVLKMAKVTYDNYKTVTWLKLFEDSLSVTSIESQKKASFNLLSDDILVHKLSMTMFSSKDITNNVIKHLNIVSSDSKIRIDSTDGYKMSSIKNINVSNFEGVDFNILVPQTFISKIFKDLNKHTPIQIDVYDDYIEATINGVTIKDYLLLDVEFPKLDKIVPKLESSVEVDIVELLSTLDKAIALQKKTKTKFCNFVFSNDSILVSSSNPEVGYFSESVNVLSSVGELKFESNYNIDFLRTIVSAVSKIGYKTIRLNVLATLSPIVVNIDSGVDKVVFMLMPVRG